MSSNIPDSFDKADPHNLKVIRIEPDMKHFILIPYKGREINSNMLTRFTLFLYLQEKIQKILNPSDKLIQIKDLFTTLNQLKQLLQTLMKNDSSQDNLFAEALSKNWHLIIDHAVDASYIKPSPHYLTELKKFINTIHSYPENDDHTLGYYLTEYAGESWLPFPFIHILYALHENALLTPSKSTLSTWIKEIDNIIYSQ